MKKNAHIFKKKYNKFSQNYVSFLCIFFIFSCIQDKIVNWKPTFDSKDKIPYGTYILKQELENLFPKNDILVINKNTLEFLKEEESNQNKLYEDSEEYKYVNSDNYLYINDILLQDSILQKELYRFCYDGNVAFISSNYLPKWFPGLEKLEMNEPLKFIVGDYKSRKNKQAKVQFYVENENLPNDTTSYGGGVKANFYSKLPMDTKILGYVKYKGKNEPNFIQIPVGKGALILHAEPYVFTNYELLRSNHYKYTENCLSFLNDNTILWDNERMESRYLYGTNNGGFFNYIQFAWKHPSLRYSLLIIFFSGIMYLVFNSTRRQRAIPFIKPFKNESLMFAETMAKLYSKTDNFVVLSQPKINFFLDEIKRKYFLSGKLDETFISHLSKKSNVNEALCEKIIQTILKLQKNTSHSKNDFLTLCILIDKFNTSIKEN